MQINQAAVIGSGVMGMGIAAQIANAGVPVVLLDLAVEGDDPAARAKGAIARALKTDPAPFMDPKAARLITPGTIEHDLDRLSDVDWIVEVVIENPDIKRDLYARLEAVRKDGSIVTSNTSTIPLALLTKDQPERFRRDFLITHFFNPPRYMRLLELVPGPDTTPQATALIREFCDVRLGKGVVEARDRPGFIANRIGSLWIQAAINATLDLGLTVEEADAVSGRPLGVPRTATFALVDLVGLDLMPMLAESLLANLPTDDLYARIHRDFPLLERMVAEGYTGRKGKGGFYALDDKRQKLAIDLATGEYAPANRSVALDSLEAAKKDGIAALIEHPDRGGQFAWALLKHGLWYAATLVGEIAETPDEIDRAMILGYGWKQGPMQLLDAIGTARFAEKLQQDGWSVPAFLQQAAGRPIYRTERGVREQLCTDGAYRPVPRPEGVLLLEDIQRVGKPVERNGAAALWDLGDGVLCLEFRTKMNSIEPGIIEMVTRATALIGDGSGAWKGLVIYNEGSNFSVGANLGLVLFGANIAAWGQLEQGIEDGQQAFRGLKDAPFPVVAAPASMALGGGCEICLHADAIQAHAETYMGLVEVGVGIIPGWGGCARMVERAMTEGKGPGGPMPGLSRVFEAISTAKVSKSAAEARNLGFLRAGDGITMNRDRLLADAKARLLQLAEGYQPPEPAPIRLPGPTAKAAFSLAVSDQVKLGRATPHDVTVTHALADIVSGGDTDITVEMQADDLYALEKQAFSKLIRTEKTLKRMEHMLETGKPLRN